MITKLYLIRHGEVETRGYRVFGGSRMDLELSPRGHEQAGALGAWLKRHPVEAVYVSPMKRARQTHAGFNGHGPETPVILDDLREVDFGDWTGHTWEGVQEKFGMSAYDWLHQLTHGGFPNGDSEATLRARVNACVEQILRDQTGKSTAVVCHGGIVRMILAILLELPMPRMAGFEIDYASITAVELIPHKRHRVEVKLMNFAPWRDIG